MSSIRPGSLLRVWAFCARANTYPDETIFAEQDAIVADATRYGHRLIFVLADWSGQANDGTGPKTASWLTYDTYLGAYQTWLDKIVARYAGEPTVAIWDLLNEPQAATVTGDLLRFVERMGARVKKLAPNALVTLGFNTPAISSGAIANYKTVCASACLDFCSFHDYSEFSSVGTSFPEVLKVARALNKPILIDEIGVYAGPLWDTTKTGPAGFTAVSHEAQAAIIGEKLRQYATFEEVVGGLVWSEMEAGVTYPAYEPPVGSPSRAIVKDIDPAMSGFNTDATVPMEGWFRATDTWRSVDGGTARIYKHGAASGNYSNNALISRHSVRNGLPAWECGTPQRLWTDLRAGAPAQTWFVVFQPTTLTAGREHYLIGADSQGGLSICVDGTTKKVKMCVAGAGVIGSSVTAVLLNRAVLVEAHYTAASGAWSIWLNGILDASGTTVKALSASHTIIAAKYSWQSGGEYVGYLFELLKYAVDLPANDAAKVRSYLRTEYAL